MNVLDEIYMMISEQKTCQDDVDSMGMDQALLRIRYNGNVFPNQTLSLWLQSEECIRCPLIQTRICNVTSEKIVQLLVDTKFATNIALRDLDGTADLCRLQVRFKEHASYNWTVSEHGSDLSCQLDKVSDAENAFLPILYVFLAFVIIWVLYCATEFGRRCWMKQQSTVAPDPGTDQQEGTIEEVKPAPTTARKARLRSLDAFRGISIVTMIFVNLGGGGYWFFQHSTWNGLTVADLVFPWFMFIMGTSMYLAINSAIRKQIPLSTIWLNILRRSVTLFALGLFLNSEANNDLRTFRILGVLQRFGITYFIVGSFLCIGILVRGYGNTAESTLSLSIFCDIKTLWLEWLLVLVLVIVHTLITFLLPVPGCPRGYLGPGGLADNGQYENCTGGATGYVDRLILTPDHMYAWPTCKWTYKTRLPYDPEGLLGQLTGTLTVFFGVQAGATLRAFSSSRSRIIRWIGWGFICGIAAGVLCTFSRDDGWIPVSKNLWSVSYVLVMAAMSFIPFAVLYYIIDVVNWWHGAPFYQAGMNSLVLYMAHECFGNYLPVTWKPFTNPPTHAELLAMHAWGTSLFVVIAIYLHHKKIFLSV